MMQHTSPDPSHDGYYSCIDTLLGPHGHFTTAPRLSPAFNGAVSRLLEELVDGALAAQSAGPGDDVPPEVVLVELGAGEGDLAKAVLEDWEARRPDLRERLTCAVVEIGEHLRARQRETLAGVTNLGWRVAWVDAVGEALEGSAAAVIVGSEFVDALPVNLIDVRGEHPVEAWVEVGPMDGVAAAACRELWGRLSPEAEAELQAVFGTVDAAALRPFTRDGVIEVRPSARDLIRQLGAGPRAVCLLTIDYGEWYGETARLRDRTVRGYFRHQVVTDPYARVGRQDLTADVDFQALHRHGQDEGFETVLFTTVADLLRADGGERRLEELRQEAGGALEADRQATILEGLLDAQGLGGAFKVMLQVRE